jgi:hypothetical protein
MKLIPIWAGCAAVFITGALLVTIARSQEQSEDTSPSDDFTIPLPEIDSEASGFPGVMFLLNTETWELSYPSGKRVNRENNPEAVEERHAANLATQDPVEYERIFQKTAELRMAIEEAVRSAHSPKTVDENLRGVKEPNKLKELQRAIAGILNPEPISDETIRLFESQSPEAWKQLKRP